MKERKRKNWRGRNQHATCVDPEEVSGATLTLRVLRDDGEEIVTERTGAEAAVLPVLLLPRDTPVVLVGMMTGMIE